MNYIIIVTDCDCIVSFYSFHGTEKDMLSVLKKKSRGTPTGSCGTSGICN